MNRTTGRLAAGMVLVALVGGGLATPVLAVTPTEVTFSFTGAEQQFVVPAGVSSLHVVLIGGRGGGNADIQQPIHAGRGAQVTADLAVTSGAKLFVEVGGIGQIAGGGFNGGGAGGIQPGNGSPGSGGGGGASDLRTVSRSSGGSLASRRIIAAAGGGAGTWGSGGDAGNPGSTAANGLASGGGAGTASSGGAGGSGGAADGVDGSLGGGGQGGGNANVSNEGGGGGGAGLYGGGGGGLDASSTGSAGGGGGSSYTGSATNASVALDDTGIPSITITFIDTSLPTVSAPVASFSTSSTIGSTVPVKLTWTGADTGSGIDHYEVWLSTNGGAYALVASPTSATYTSSMTPSSTTTYRFRVRAFDKAGNMSGFVYGPTFHVKLVQQSSTAVHYYGTWSSASNASASGGSYRSTSIAGRYTYYTFTGRAIGVVAYKGTALGSFKVYIDGVYKTTVSDYATSTQWRRIVYSKTWSSSGTHTIRLVCVGTAGHPKIDLDAFLVLG